MNRNIFLKKKINNEDKFNPDLDNTYNKKLNDRSRDIQPENLPYKPIIDNVIDKPVNKIKLEDLLIDLDENNVDISDRYEDMESFRKLLNKELKNKYKADLEEDFSDMFAEKIMKIKMMSLETDSFNEVKKESRQFYDDLQRKIDSDKSEIDQFMKSLMCD
jgi:hypothetical protein